MDLRNSYQTDKFIVLIDDNGTLYAILCAGVIWPQKGEYNAVSFGKFKRIIFNDAKKFVGSDEPLSHEEESALIERCQDQFASRVREYMENHVNG